MFARHANGTVVRAFTSLGWVLAWLSIKKKHEPGFRAEDRTNFVVFNKYTGGIPLPCEGNNGPPKL